MIQSDTRDARRNGPTFCQVLRQRYAIALRKRDELRDRFQHSVRGAQQKSGFRNLLLERKLGGLAEESEKRDACVNEVGTVEAPSFWLVLIIPSGLVVLPDVLLFHFEEGPRW